ncbi:hypothetical protein PSCICP_39780 [Pseudomonas cichorii]|uniref:Uncharacterized protein n=1 Tax=Pseudomonas cichorii TaxID=36746 RepID=A0ABQ1DSP4_PSECI|nr:hypothetical protein PSCICP_39780 [Pseudomonas cichorii]
MNRNGQHRLPASVLYQRRPHQSAAVHVQRLRCIFQSNGGALTGCGLQAVQGQCGLRFKTLPGSGAIAEDPATEDFMAGHQAIEGRLQGAVVDLSV